jgi:hypothetical protein
LCGKFLHGDDHNPLAAFALQFDSCRDRPGQELTAAAAVFGPREFLRLG